MGRLIAFLVNLYYFSNEEPILLQRLSQVLLEFTDIEAKQHIFNNLFKYAQQFKVIGYVA